MTADLNLAELCHGAEFCGADAVIITGSRTGDEAQLEDVKEAKTAGLPVVIGSGITLDNIADYAKIADAVIVGSWLKEAGKWRNPVDQQRVRALKDVLTSS